MEQSKEYIEKFAEQLHIWYLEATEKLNPDNYYSKAQVSYKELNEEQKFIDRYIAEKIISKMSG